MDIKQKTYLQVEKHGKLVQLVVDQDAPLGLIFDALMELKGYICERMVKAHQEEAEYAEKMMAPSEVSQVEDVQESQHTEV